MHSIFYFEFNYLISVQFQNNLSSFRIFFKN